LNPSLAGGGRGLFPVRLQNPLFKRLQCVCVLRVMARPRRELDIAELLQFPAHGRFIKRDRKLRMEPLCQVRQSPAHNPMDRRDRTAFNDRYKRLALGIIELGRGPGALPSISASEPRDQSAGIEPHDPFVGETVHRTICRPTPPIRAASLRLPPSWISASASNRRLWFAFFVFRAKRLTVAPSKSTRNAICTHDHVPPDLRPWIQTFRALGIHRESAFAPLGMTVKVPQGCSVLMIWAVAVIGVQRQPPWPVGGLGFA